LLFPYHSVDHIIAPITFVARIIGPFVDTIATLYSIRIFSIIVRTINPFLLSMAFLLVLEPLALVDSSILALIFTLPMGPIIEPVAHVNVARYVHELAITLGVVVLEHALILRAVFPFHDAVAISEAAKPFTLIHST
jgi:hypothetical protein